MVLIGLTGGIGSGKSTVSTILRNNRISVIDADVISRNVLGRYPEIINGIRIVFGSNFFDCRGNLDRKKFGDYIFSEKILKSKYENIIMPFIKKDIFSEIDRLKNYGSDVCVLDGATLIENKFHIYMDEIILVWVDVDTQINRVKTRDRLTTNQVLLRINSQMTLNEKKKYATFILDNSGDICSTRQNLKDIFIRITMKYKGVKCPKFDI
ncbi:MAG: dephospho-CoA kinase [Clostridium sp.]|jgi:dephospho-CoA kinase|uniref:dephospho-CoA kinase n=1 Tax=Clostridium sp. TaxID=1506 RepID=UPI0025C279C4|nr:dephospho-CoA kinase [Clostridium sp.]MCH3964747.1 dephospho-CoA kinase [Clostridium sp.]MCI1715218.1 dephospho-CoA kinase [Clostridium sp.]MCI1799480.1 dephospho-CoA kinase [Clostridium sp.]MCI1813401.1 dephospho-CoA kinase [Clostridium sp.]MCI1870292.1 dephospho-CoA kinase [Clostridium sp.]